MEVVAVVLEQMRLVVMERRAALEGKLMEGMVVREVRCQVVVMVIRNKIRVMKLIIRMLGLGKLIKLILL